MTDLTAEQYDTLEPIIGGVTVYSLKYQVDVFNFTPNADGDWVRISEVRRAILQYMNDGPAAPCLDCGGTGWRDTGGVQPWGEAITIVCDCEYAQSQMGQSTNSTKESGRG